MNDAQTPKPLDRRQRKTRQAIQNALLSLMKEKPLSKITVSELAATADVNRKTFYNHYSNIQEVRDELDQ
ncbi:MAG: TetR/AcrR family transcriptional regulator [Clostridiales bacterium]|nr:TetR/AcrR family transcriptional regulator [Clostridiales bacterium]